MTGPDLIREWPDRPVAASDNLKRARVAEPRAAGGHRDGPGPVPHWQCAFFKLRGSRGITRLGGMGG
jgi:hypothetical protein